MEEFDSSRTSSSRQTEAITEFSLFIEKLDPILSEIKCSFDANGSSKAMKGAIDSLQLDYERAKALIDRQNVRCSPNRPMEHLAQSLGRSLGLVLFTSREVDMFNKEKIEALCKEMMNVRFESSMDIEFDIDEIIEEEKRVLRVDDVVLDMKFGSGERFEEALFAFSGFIDDGVVSMEVVDEDLVKILYSRLSSSSCKGCERMVVIRTLRHLVDMNVCYKENLKSSEILSALVKSLARDDGEQREAVALLSKLSDDTSVRRRIGRMQGCIVMLVVISNGDDQKASYDATMLLNAMSGNTQHALHMAEAGYFKPLIGYLNEGSEMSKILMATTLSRLELTDQNKSSIGEHGAIEHLVKMFHTGNLESKLVSLNALNSLSNSKSNIQRLIDSGLVVTLLQLLFSVTSVLMTLREPASAILAKVAQSEKILVKHDVAQQMLSLLNLSSPVIQNHLLEALNNIVLHTSADKVRTKMRENGAVQLLVPFFMERDDRIRTGALKLVYSLSNGMQGELVEQLGYKNVHVIANVVSTSTWRYEKEVAFGILSNMPVSDRKITDVLKNANLLPLMVSIMSSTPVSICLAERIVGVLVRFTVQTDKRLQSYSAEHGIIHVLVNLLSSNISSDITKSKAALCLTQLSMNSRSLAKSRARRWFCMPPSMDSFCLVHDGYCSVKGTFCLVKAGAITPLIEVLGRTGERSSDEAVLTCLSTLVQDEKWENGCDHLAKMRGVEALIRVLTLGSVKSKEKALWILERVFRIEVNREKYGASAQVVLIDLAQNGDAILAPIVAKLLAQLELLQEQSSYF